MKKLILTACLASCLATTPHHVQAMHLPHPPAQKSSSFMATIKKHKGIAITSGSLITLGIGFIIMAIYTAPSLSDLFNPEQAEKDSTDCLVFCHQEYERVNKIYRAQRFLALGVASLLAAGCTLGYGAYKAHKSLPKLPTVPSLRPSSNSPLPEPLHGFELNTQPASQNLNDLLAPTSSNSSSSSSTNSPAADPLAPHSAAPAQPADNKSSLSSASSSSQPGHTDPFAGKTVLPPATTGSTQSMEERKEAPALIPEKTATHPEMKLAENNEGLLAAAIDTLTQSVAGKSDNDKVDATDDIMTQIAALPVEQQQQSLTYLKQQLGLKAEAQQELDRALTTALDVAKALTRQN